MVCSAGRPFLGPLFLESVVVPSPGTCAGKTPLRPEGWGGCFLG